MCQLTACVGLKIPPSQVIALAGHNEGRTSKVGAIGGLSEVKNPSEVLLQRASAVFFL